MVPFAAGVPVRAGNIRLVRGSVKRVGPGAETRAQTPRTVHALQPGRPAHESRRAESARAEPRSLPVAAPSVSPHRPRSRVLVLAREAVIAALVGMLLELEDYEPVFAAPDERPEEALRRLRPPLIVVLDGQLPEATSDLFLARCAQSGARVCLFGEPVVADEVRAAARTRRLGFFAMPVDRRELGAALALAQTGSD